jgi:hypothetical protein
MRLRIFSKVDLPAPFLPIADDFRLAHGERDVLQRPERLLVLRGRSFTERRTKNFADALSQNVVRRHLSAKAIELSDSFRDDDVAHHITSANSRSVCLK